MRRTIIAALLFCLGSVAMAQTPDAPVPVQHFVINGNASGNSGTGAVSIEGAAFQLTHYVSVGYARISDPTDSTKPIYNLGEVNVAYELGDLLPKKVKGSLAFDPTNWIVTFQGSAGKVKAPKLDRVAEGLGVYLSRPVANTLQLTSGFRFLHGAGVGVTWVKMPVVGLTFTF